MSEIKIDTDIPVPTGGTCKYPLRAMKIGDSFFAPGRASQSITGSFAHARQRMNAPTAKWTTRTITENGVKGVRVWRIA